MWNLHWSTHNENKFGNDCLALARDSWGKKKELSSFGIKLWPFEQCSNTLVKSIQKISINSISLDTLSPLDNYYWAYWSNWSSFPHYYILKYIISSIHYFAFTYVLFITKLLISFINNNNIMIVVTGIEHFSMKCIPSTLALLILSICVFLIPFLLHCSSWLVNFSIVREHQQNIRTCIFLGQRSQMVLLFHGIWCLWGMASWCVKHCWDFRVL